jgi:hypothetical protein
MTQKLLISTDRNGIAEFQKAVTATAEAASSLIELYHTFQPWKRIRTVEDFISLASDPADFFDSTLLDNVEIKAAGVTPDPGRLAELIGIHRAEFLNLCSGLNIPDEDNCQPCGKVRIKRGQRAITLSEFNRYSQYLNFNSGVFSVDQTKVDAALDKFSTYAESEEEIELHNHFTALVEMLNKHDSMYTLPNPEKKTIATALHLHLTEAYQGAFMLDIQYLSKEISKLKYQK